MIRVHVVVAIEVRFDKLSCVRGPKLYRRPQFRLLSLHKPRFKPVTGPSHIAPRS